MEKLFMEKSSIMLMANFVLLKAVFCSSTAMGIRKLYQFGFEGEKLFVCTQREKNLS